MSVDWRSEQRTFHVLLRNVTNKLAHTIVAQLAVWVVVWTETESSQELCLPATTVGSVVVRALSLSTPVAGSKRRHILQSPIAVFSEVPPVYLSIPINSDAAVDARSLGT